MPDPVPLDPNPVTHPTGPVPAGGPSEWVYIREGSELAWPRFWARLIDIIFWYTVFGLLAVPITLFLPMVPEMVVLIFGLFLYAFVEAAVLTSFSITPGKWVMGLTVTDQEGKALSYAPALKRSLDVFLRGMGMGLPFVQVVCWAVCYDRLKKRDVMWWDVHADARVSGPEIHGWKKLLGVVLVAAVLVLWIGGALLKALGEAGA